MLVIDQPHRPQKKKIPPHLIYEVLNGKPLPYRGYINVMKGNLKLEDIMGSSELQSVIVYILGLYIGNNIDRKKYTIATNEAGIHLDKDNNLANDIAIYHKKQKLTKEYSKVAPILAIEVDSKVDMKSFNLETDGQESYLINKSRTLLAAGTQKVVWILTAPRKIYIATIASPWQVVDFDFNIPLLDDCILNLADLLQEEEVNY